MDTFPYESWEEAIAAAQESGEAFFTFGSGGAVPLTILGAIAMVVSLVMFVTTERRNLEEHAARYRDEGVV